MTELNTLLNNIKQEKDTKLLPKNVKKDIEVLGVTGTLDITSVLEKAVRFYDYDGTLMTWYSAEDFANLTALPGNPSHIGLTAQGWNWSLADAKAYVASYGELNVGQMYVTDDNKTRIYIHLEEGRTEPYLGFASDSEVVVDWGDNSTTTVIGQNISTVVYTLHTYPSAGDYVITLSTSGSIVLHGTNSATRRFLFIS